MLAVKELNVAPGVVEVNVSVKAQFIIMFTQNDFKHF